jgi:ParB family chromosome partitioning protein
VNTKRERPYKTSLTDKVDLLFRAEIPSGNATRSAPLSSIKPGSFQPRYYFDEAKLEELARTVAAHGILEPLLVRESEDGFELIAGGRRYRAAGIAGLKEAPITVLNLTDEQCLEVAILENLQREDLNPIEETEGILKLLESRLKQGRKEVVSLLYRLRNERLSASSRNVSTNPEAEVVAEIFEPLGISWKSFVETRLPLLKLPDDVLDALREGKIEYTKAKAIAKVKNEEERAALLKDALDKELSLNRIKERLGSLVFEEDDAGEPNPTKIISEAYGKLKKSQLWKKDPKRWRKVKTLLKKLEELLDENARDTGSPRERLEVSGQGERSPLE